MIEFGICLGGKETCYEAKERDIDGWDVFMGIQFCPFSLEELDESGFGLHGLYVSNKCYHVVEIHGVGLFTLEIVNEGILTKCWGRHYI